MKAIRHYTPLIGALVALGATLPSIHSLADDAGADASGPVIATEQPPLPGTGPNPGDNLRAQMQASPGSTTTLSTGAAIHDSFGTPLIAREVPAAPGTGPNSGDLARAAMQSDPTEYAALGTRYPSQPDAGSVASVAASSPELHGRAGWNPALVQLQAAPQPFPWETRMAKTPAPDQSAKAEVKQ